MSFLWYLSGHVYLFNDTKIDMLVSVLWVGFISVKLRYQLPRYWFFSWWPILGVLCIVAGYALSSFLGLRMEREESFPALVVMLPTIAALLILSVGSTIYGAMKSLWRNVRVKASS